MRKHVLTFWIIVLGLFLNSCGVQWQYTTYNTAGQIDAIYDENYIPRDTVDSEEELERKWRFDSEFREDYYTYLTYQDYSFFSDMYWRNRMWRWGWTSSWDYYTNWQWNWYGGHNYWSPWNQYPWYGNWSSSYWYWYQWNNPWQYNYSYVYGPRTNWLGNVYHQRPSNRWRQSISNRSSIANTIQNNREKPRVIINSNKPVINNIQQNNNWNTNNRPNINNKPSNNNIIVKPNNNSRPVYNNNSRPVYNNNSRPSNNWSKPSNTSRPSNNSRSISTPRKRGGQ